MQQNLTKWLRLGFINLAIVAFYGAMMRYKIAFDFPYLEQKNLLHAHSHFAFSGWVSQMLYTGLAQLLFPYITTKRKKNYKKLLLLNLICSFGMLVAFTAQGYKIASIVFSTLSIFTALAFAIFFIKDIDKMENQHPSKPWAVAGLLLNLLSAAGPFSLAYMMMTQNISQDMYLGSIYYYLHFQYSGWFLFGSIAIASAYLPNNIISFKKLYKVWVITVVPTFFLSILWAKIPDWLYAITVVATIAQLMVWIMLLPNIWNYIKYSKPLQIPLWVRVLFYTSLVALTIKLLLQAVSVIPSLSQLVFGYRPIVIAYLHLVLLGIYSLFLIGFLFYQRILYPCKAVKMAAVGFLTGVLLNELLLGIQGFAAFAYIPVPFINEMLLVAAAILLISAVALSVLQFKKHHLPHPPIIH